VAVAYRGYSHSEGKPTEEGLKLDADAIVEYVRDKENSINKDKMFI